MGQERKRDVLEVEMHRRGQQLIVLLQRLLHDVLADIALQHIVHVVKHLADLAQDGRVIEAADGVVGQLLRRDLGAGQTAHVDDGDNLLHAGGAGALDAVMAGDNLQNAVFLHQQGQALKLAAVLDVRGKLILHFLLHDAGVDVLLPHLIELDFGNNQAGAHVVNLLVAHCCALFCCHCFSLLSHSANVAFSSRPATRAAS